MSTNKKKCLSKKIEVSDKHDRNVLNEGRNYQMGFAFAAKIGDDKYSSVMPISPCKDYMNDVIYVEETKKSMSVHGFSYKPQDLFKTKENFAYVMFKICPKKNGGTNYPDYKKDIDNLKGNYHKVQRVINHAEEMLKVDGRTEIYAANDDTFLATIPKYWVQYTYLISLWTLIVRMAQFWDGKGSEENFLETYSHTLDKSLWTPAKVKYKLLIEKGLYKQDLTKYQGSYDVHNCGILGINLKF